MHILNIFDMCIITHVENIPKFNIKYLVIQSVQMHSGALCYLISSLCVLMVEDQLTYARVLLYLTTQTHKAVQ